MSITNPALSKLPDDKRSAIEALLVDFDLEWTSTRLLDSTLAQTEQYESELRRAVLSECIKIDLEKRWDQGDAIRLEWYLREIPQLGSRDDLPPDLVQAEFETRCRYERVQIEELRDRFPKQAEELEHLIAQQIELSKPPEEVPVSKPDPIPARFGRYRIRRKIGDGGMGQVFLAWDTKLEREMAIKIPNATESVELADRLQREAATAARLRHKNICPVYDVGVIEGRQFIAMAYIEGETLAEKIRRDGALDSAQAVRILNDVASGVEHAHGQGVVHRDLKPSNIIIEPDGTPVVTDFGLAQMLDQPNIMMTPANTPVGTPAYMAPEQIRGARGEIGPRTDVYGLGTVLYEMLTGRVPFTGSYSEVLADAFRVAPVPPSKVNPATPPALERICLKALSKEKKDRFESASTMANALVAEIPPGQAVAPKKSLKVGWLIGLALLAAVAVVFINREETEATPKVLYPALEFETIVEVSTHGELMEAVETCVPGTEIRIAPGEYSGVYLSDLDTDQTPLKLTALDPSDPPVFGKKSDGEFSIMLARCFDVYISHIRFKGAETGFDAEDCTRLAISNCQFVYPQVGSTHCTALNLKRVECGYVGDCRVVGWNEGVGISLRNSVACVLANNQMQGSEDENDDTDNIGIAVRDGSVDCLVLGNEVVGFESSLILGGIRLEQVDRFGDAEACRIVAQDNLLSNSLSGVWFSSATDSVFERNTVNIAQYGLIRFVKDGEAQPVRNVVRNNLFLFKGDDSGIICSPDLKDPVILDVNHWHRYDKPKDCVPYNDWVKFEPGQQMGLVEVASNGVPVAPSSFGRLKPRVTELPPLLPSVSGATAILLEHSARELANSKPLSDAQLQ